MINYQKILDKNLLNAFIEILKNIEMNGLDGNNLLYITFRSSDSGNIVPGWLLQKYTNEMTIVIQHEYYNLSVNKNSFNIGLSFNNKKTNLKISFNSIVSFVDPSVNFGLKIKNEILKTENKLSSKKNLKNNNIINFSKYKKKI